MSRRPMRTFWVMFWGAVIGFGLSAGICIAAMRALTEVFR